MGTIKTDGTGDNRTKKRGGTYLRVNTRDIADSDTFRIVVDSGEFKYVTVHARSKGGSWSTIYKGEQRVFPVAEYIKEYMAQSNINQIIFSVNGGHERYESIACTARVVKCADQMNVPPVSTSPEPLSSDCSELGTIETDGTGDNRTKKRGGTYLRVNTRDIADSDTFRIVVDSGEFKYVTVHARSKGGSWSTIYKGEQRVFPVAEYIKEYMAQSNINQIIFSVNGGHERYESIACEARVTKCPN